MIIDSLEHSARYNNVHPRIQAAFDYLRSTDLSSVAPGKYAIDGDTLFAIVQEYDTMSTANEQMEAHRKYIDVQYMITGAELVGHTLHNGQMPSKEYDAAEDYMLYPDTPSFFSLLSAGTFMVFFPTDLHMPCINVGEVAKVKKVVVKCAV